MIVGKILSNDHVYRRVKDALMIIATIIALTASFRSYVTAPVMVENRIKDVERAVAENTKSDEEMRRKYVPIVEQTDKNLVILVEQQKLVLYRLERIERKLP